MLTVRVGGVWLHSIGPYADLTMSHAWPRGSEELSYRMRPNTSHPVLDRGGALVECFNGGLRVWHGRHAEPAANGSYSANGSWSRMAGFLAIDGAGAASNTPDTAIDAAIARGLGLTRPASLSAAAWGTAGEPMTLLDLLDQAMAGLGKRWWVDADGAIRSAVDPTTPSFLVPHAAAGRGLDLAEDSYYSHLIGSYLLAGPAFATVTVGNTAAATRWGYKEAQVDLTPMGVITTPTATTQVTNRLALTGARMGFAESLECGYGQVTTLGGTPVTLSMLTAIGETGGVMIRLQGVSDRTRVAESSVTDVLLSRSVYTDEAPTIHLEPTGKAPRDLAEVLKATAA